jgi:hypothetical protein
VVVKGECRCCVLLVAEVQSWLGERVVRCGKRVSREVCRCERKSLIDERRQQ